jgi:hypothetical protein
MRIFCPAAKSAEASELISITSETKARRSDVGAKRSASDQTVSPGVTVTVMNLAPASVARSLLAPALTLTREPKTIARERTTKVRASRPQRVRWMPDGAVEKPRPVMTSAIWPLWGRVNVLIVLSSCYALNLGEGFRTLVR